LHILHIDTGSRMRGGQWQVLRLMQGLTAARIDNTLLAPAGSELFEKALARDLCVRSISPRNLLAGADVVHAHDARAHALAAIAARRPLVVSRRVAFPIRRGVLSRWKYARATHYIAVSEFVRRGMLTAGIPSSKIVVVYDGVPLLAPVTGGDRILAPPLSPDKPAGLYPPHGISFAGDLAADLASACMLLYLSPSEGLGSAILLAMSAGVPVIASKVGGIPEIIRHEQNGLLVDNTPASVAEAIARLQQDHAFAQLLAVRARQTIEEKFSLDIMIRQTLALYRQVAAC
jgi:glycosyl transferase family 1/glycosyl transferase family 4